MDTAELACARTPSRRDTVPALCPPRPCRSPLAHDVASSPHPPPFPPPTPLLGAAPWPRAICTLRASSESALSELRVTGTEGRSRERCPRDEGHRSAVKDQNEAPNSWSRNDPAIEAGRRSRPGVSEGIAGSGWRGSRDGAAPGPEAWRGARGSARVCTAGQAPGGGIHFGSRHSEPKSGRYQAE